MTKKEDIKTDNDQGTQGGDVKTSPVISRSGLYNHTAKHAVNAIAVLVELMNDKDVQASVRVSAAGKLLDKVLPDLKASELTGVDGGAMKHEVDIKADLVQKMKEIFTEDGKHTTTSQDPRTE